MNSRPAIARHVPLIAALVTLVAMVLLSRSFGATWDERALQSYGEQIWDYYAGVIPRSAIDVSFGYTRIYGGLVEFASVAAQHAVKADPYVVRHAVNSVFGWIGIVFAFLMASRLFGTRAGWLAAVLLASMPRYPEQSVLELYRVVKPGGHLVLSTPNRLWQAPVRAASALGWRPYDGFENFLWPSQLRGVLERAGGQLEDHRGLHLWPFQIRSLHRGSTWMDRFGAFLLPLMINQRIHCTKPGSPL